MTIRNIIFNYWFSISNIRVVIIIFQLGSFIYGLYNDSDCIQI